MAYTDIDKPSEFFETLIFTGDNTNNRDITGLDFTPDLTWITSRAGASDRGFFDSVRGADKSLRSNEIRTEDTSPNNKDIDSFISGGIRVDQSNYIDTNTNNALQVAWNWKAGTSATLSGSDITPSANSISTKSGFGIYAYTGNGNNGQGMKHGLGTLVTEMWVKKRTNDTQPWAVYSRNDNTEHLVLNETAASVDGTNRFSHIATNDVVNFGPDEDVNASGDTYIAYAFSARQGFSKFATYLGNNNADGTFVYLGFKPAWIMTKCTTDTGNWVIFDNKRGGFNQQNNHLFANTNAVEVSDNADYKLDFLSNGFKFRGNSGDINGADTYTYMAFAEQPLVTSKGVPATAR